MRFRRISGLAGQVASPPANLFPLAFCSSPDTDPWKSWHEWLAIVAKLNADDPERCGPDRAAEIGRSIPRPWIQPQVMATTAEACKISGPAAA
jgi:hypothetical protein